MQLHALGSCVASFVGSAKNLVLANGETGIVFMQGIGCLYATECMADV